jgi:uncharacterized protein (DUF1015 family)
VPPVDSRAPKTEIMDVKPFRAFRFDPRIVGDAGACVAPPYDVLDEAERDALCRRNPYNIAHITKGPLTAADSEGNNQYTRAAAYLQTWIAAGALKEDDQDTIYGYVQDFEMNDMAFQRLSFIALGKLEEFGQVVRPHEQVFAKPLLDRLSLERATAARFGLVFMLYDDPEGIADQIIARAVTGIGDQGSGDAGPRPAPALIDFTDQQAVRHRLYAVTAAADIQAVQAMMRDKSCIIADGHHRYTVGLTYLRESGNPKARYQMMAFTNMRQKGLVVLATHRLVGGLVGFRRLDFIADVEPRFRLVQFQFSRSTRELSRQQMLDWMRDGHERGETVFGIYTGDRSFYLATLEDTSLMTAAAPDKSDAWRALDVSVLQKLVLEGLLGLDEEKMGNPEYVEYVKDTPRAIEDLIRQVDAGRRQIAFFTNPVRLPQLAAVTDAGERMPHKSTYFYPKMYTGLTIQKL